MTTKKDIDRYYQLLGIRPDAGISAIKKAYRNKAFLLHPDKNPGKDTREAFIQVTEAYEKLIAFKEGRLRLQQDTDWLKEQENARRAEARRRTAAAARAREEAERNSDAYKTADALEAIFSHIYFLFGLAFFSFIIFLVVVFLKAVGWVMLIFGLIFGTKPLLRSIKESNVVDLPRLWNAILYLSAKSGLLALLFLIANIFTFRQFVPVTLINYGTLTILYLLSIFPAYGYLKIRFNEFHFFRHVFIPLSVGPSIMSVLLSVNFLFSGKPHHETYLFQREVKIDERGIAVTQDIIHLQGGVYEEYEQIRNIPLNPSNMGKNQITYHFEHGLLGLKVMKSYDLQREIVPALQQKN
ncbi:MAG: J domain-containing protein [Flavobacteriales bacterium]